MAIHIGLMGGGNISETHARAARAIPGVTIAAVYGTNASKVEKLCHTYGGNPIRTECVPAAPPHGLRRHRQVLRACTRHRGIAAARRGLHVLTEKPIDISKQRAEELIEGNPASRREAGSDFSGSM